MRFVLPEPNSGCWLWIGRTNDEKDYGSGYARFRLTDRVGYGHVVAYELLRGPIPEGFELDHLCRVRCCVNPWHIEVVTHQENIRRAPRVWEAAVAFQQSKTHCPKGHEYNKENTGRRKKGLNGGHRFCKICTRLLDAAR
jgi:hypothetical protein